MIVRRRGTVIIETPKGILLTASRNKRFMLPGGGAHLDESRRRAAIRELEEETSLKAIDSQYLFSHKEPKYDSSGRIRKVRNKHKVFLVHATGIPTPNYKDVSHITYFDAKKKIKIDSETRRLINVYLRRKKR